MDELKEMAKDDPRIRFVGFVEGTLRKELLSSAYAYVLPSDLEGMPLSLLEAMSYGNCCLTSDIPACTEVVEDHALTFPKGDVEALAAQMQYLCDNPQVVEEYQTAAPTFIQNKYNWDTVVEETIALYRGDKA
jgi:glycosyltransferase involved in cell wall biosynthesis